jgi:UDP-N-acetylenolpyruvoylglucosamine reductase
VTTRPQVSVAARVEHDVPLARLTTVGIGGPARAFARPETIHDLEQLIVWAGEAALPVIVVGLGSNVLAADSGVDGLVVRLGGELSSVEIEATRLVAGGGVANAVALHRARAAGLGGMEFACAIPGTAGGGVRMNAGAYGRDWSDIVERALVVTADGAGWLSRNELDLRYRHSALEPGQIVARVEFQLESRDPTEIRHEVAELNARRKATQPINRRTFGSVFKNPDHELGAGPMLDTCGLKGYAVGGARISPRHANFIENVEDATAADALSLMSEARRRALEQFGIELEREVELLGDLALPPAGELPCATTSALTSSKG